MRRPTLARRLATLALAFALSVLPVSVALAQDSMAEPEMVESMDDMKPMDDMMMEPMDDMMMDDMKPMEPEMPMDEIMGPM
jgi:hypothetical protein